MNPKSRSIFPSFHNDNSFKATEHVINSKSTKTQYTSVHILVLFTRTYNYIHTIKPNWLIIYTFFILVHKTDYNLFDLPVTTSLLLLSIQTVVYFYCIKSVGNSWGYNHENITNEWHMLLIIQVSLASTWPSIMHTSEQYSFNVRKE